MVYYLGKGTEFKKEECKEYKTIEGALKAAAKEDSLVVWDENGQAIGSLTQENSDGASNAYDDKNEEAAAIGEKTGAGDRQQDGDEKSVIIPQGTMKVTVICDGTLNLRRSPHWANDNICGRAARGQSYFVKEIHMVDGKKMVRTIDDIYLSGASEYVQFEQL
jgi:hypothetical protein